MEIRLCSSINTVASLVRLQQFLTDLSEHEGETSDNKRIVFWSSCVLFAVFRFKEHQIVFPTLSRAGKPEIGLKLGNMIKVL